MAILRVKNEADGTWAEIPAIVGPQGEKGDKGDDGISITHAWSGTTLIITSASGTSSADLKGDNVSATPEFYSELGRVKDDNGKKVVVKCYGLTEGETYNLHLYTSVRRRGTRQDPWRHPSNENTGKGYTGKGYANMVGLKYGNDPKVYPDVPSWMPRGGILQTEWEFTATGTTQKFEIPLETWLLPLLKPLNADFSTGQYGLIGVSNDAIAPLLFQFRVAKNGYVGECRNTLCVGLSTTVVDGLRQTMPIRDIQAASGSPKIETEYLYTSIR